MRASLSIRLTQRTMTPTPRCRPTTTTATSEHRTSIRTTQLQMFNQASVAVPSWHQSDDKRDDDRKPTKAFSATKRTALTELEIKIRASGKKTRSRTNFPSVELATVGRYHHHHHQHQRSGRRRGRRRDVESRSNSRILYGTHVVLLQSRHPTERPSIHPPANDEPTPSTELYNNLSCDGGRCFT